MAAEASGSGAVFKAIIQAVDRVSGPVEGIVNAVKGLTGVEAKAAGEEKQLHSAGVRGGEQHLAIFKRLAAHVRGLDGHFSELTGAVRGLGGAFAQMVAPLGALGGMGSLAGLIEMANAASEAFSRMSTSAAQAGVSIQTFAALSMAAKENDIPAQQLRTSLFNLSKIMGGALHGSNKKAAEQFAQLGISLKDAHGHALSAAQVLPKLADAFQHTRSATTRALMAQTLFGGRAGAMLIPILMKGSAGLAAYNREFQKIGYLPDKGGATALEEFHASWVQLTTAVSGFTMAVGAKLAPVLRPVIDQVTKWIAANRDWIATHIAGAVSELVRWVKAIDLGRVIGEMKSWWTTIKSVVHSLGGAKIILAAVALALGAPLIGAVSGVITVFVALKGALQGIAVAAMANPLVAVAVAIAAAGYLIYQNWSTIKAYFEKFWTGITPVWKGAVHIIKSNVMGIVDAFEWVWKKIQPIVGRLQGVVNWAAHSWAGRELGLGGGPGKPGTPGSPGLAGAAGAGAGRQLFSRGPNTLAGRGAPGRTVAHVQGKVEVSVALKGAPPGTRVHTATHGMVATPRVDVGFAYPGVAMID